MITLLLIQAWTGTVRVQTVAELLYDLNDRIQMQV